MRRLKQLFNKLNEQEPDPPQPWRIERIGKAIRFTHPTRSKEPIYISQYELKSEGAHAGIPKPTAGMIFRRFIELVPQCNGFTYLDWELERISEGVHAVKKNESEEITEDEYLDFPTLELMEFGTLLIRLEQGEESILELLESEEENNVEANRNRQLGWSGTERRDDYSSPDSQGGTDKPVIN